MPPLAPTFPGSPPKGESQSALPAATLLPNLPLQRFVVPLPQVGGCVIRALQKLHQRSLRRSGGSHVVIHQQKLFHLRVIEGRLWPNASFCKTWRFRRCIGVKSRPLGVPSTRPESGAADFVRVRLPGNRVSARPLPRRSAREAGHPKIEGAPQKIERACFPPKAARELL